MVGEITPPSHYHAFCSICPPDRRKGHFMMQVMFGNRSHNTRCGAAVPKIWENMHRPQCEPRVYGSLNPLALGAAKDVRTHSESHTRNAQRGRFFLNSAGIGHHELCVLQTAKEVEIALGRPT
jgi:hypothetical protein